MNDFRLLACFVVVFSIFFFSTQSISKTLYVDGSTGYDSVTYEQNSATNPWRTIGRAVWGSNSAASTNSSEAAQAGDIVLVEAGTYDTTQIHPSNDKFAVYSPVNSGTSSNPITIKANGTVTLTRSGGSSGALIGTYNSDYIIWDGFTIDEADAPSVTDTGPAVMWTTTGSQIINCKLDGDGTIAVEDNHNGIRLEQCNSCIVKNNEIHDFYTSSTTSHNGSGITMYDAEDCIIENNLIYNVGAGIYIKGDHAGDGWPQQNNIFRYNWIRDVNNKAIFAYSAVGSDIYQNVIEGGGAGGAGSLVVYGHSQSDNVDFVNNTLISQNLSVDRGFRGYGDLTATSRVRFFNNIVYGSWGEAMNLGDVSSIGNLSAEHNCYYYFDTFGSVNGRQFSFFTWQSTHGRDTVSPSGITSDPLFTDTGSSDYTLQGGSPAGSIGVDILDLDNDGLTTDNIPAGAYIMGNEMIGYTPDGNTDTPTEGYTLATPRNFSIE